MRNYKVNNILRTKLKKGDDLYYSLMNIIDKIPITAGIIIGIGAVQKANIAYFNQIKKEYENFHFNEAMEIVSLKGNISLKENKPFAHIHISLARSDFTVVGGHLLPDTIIYACEIDIIEYDGKAINRVFDEETNLYLWDL
ncbi:PPC domain-containing DNA-binding protein [Deferribacter abyssi]|uniref:PPC domain-containing DNA-binding protein n=1 Tax=Deferribacter abyssi TaxID=213806 RepID=UPI003C13B660